jgi:hypothetical protein
LLSPRGEAGGAGGVGLLDDGDYEGGAGRGGEAAEEVGVGAEDGLHQGGVGIVAVGQGVDALSVRGLVQYVVHDSALSIHVNAVLVLV